MHRSILCPALGLSAVLLAACGEDPVTTETAGATESAGTTSENPTSGSTMAPTGGQTTQIDEGTMSESLSGTTTTGPDPSTGPDPDTGGTTQIIETGGTTAGETIGDDTTGGETAGESTGGESTGGESSGGEETGDPLDCPLVAQHVPCDEDSDDPMHAFGLNCTSLGGDYVNNVNAVTIANFDLQYPDPMFGEQTWQVARSYGSFVDPNTNAPFWSPREGDKLLMISSGLLPPADGQGAVLVEDCDVFNDSYVSPNFDDPPFDDNIMPPPMSPNNGSPDPMGYTNCDGVGDCSNTMSSQWQLGGGDAEDKMWFGFELTAPAVANGDMFDAKGYTFDFAYFSAEFPEFVDTQYNDIFIVWQASEDYTGNVTFINEQPLTVTALWPIDYQGECDFDNDPNCNLEADEHLLDTGHQGCGGATGWYKATGGIKPGETFTLTFGIFDMGDSSYDTTALLDNWQWDCEGCVPNEVMSCGVDPQ